MVIETILLVDYSFKGAQEVQSVDRWEGGYNLIAPLEAQWNSIPDAHSGCFCTGLGKKNKLLLTDPADTASSGFFWAIFMFNFSD